MKRVFFLLLFIVSFVFSGPLKPSEAFSLTPIIQNDGLKIEFKIDDRIYLHAEDFQIILSDGKQINSMLSLPKQSPFEDLFVYKNNFNILIPFEIIFNKNEPSNEKIKIAFSPCSFDGFCYQPQSFIYKISKDSNKYLVEKVDSFDVQKDVKTSSAEVSDNEKIANSIKSNNLFVVLLTFFGYGILLSLTPCIFPMIPILSSIIVAKTKNNASAKSGFFISLVYVFAMSLAYAIAGILASFFGTGIQGLFQKPSVIIIFCLIFVLLSFSMFGFYQIKMPERFQNLLNKKSSKGSGVFGVFIMGFLSALIVGPCVTPPLAGALLYIAETSDIVIGGFSLFIMGIGMGIPLLIIGLGSGKILPKPGVWMVEIQKIFGFLLLGMAIWFGSRIISENTTLLLYGILGIIFSVYFGIFDKNCNKIKKCITFLICIYSIFLLIGFASGSTNFLRPLDRISISGSKNQISNEINYKNITNINELKTLIATSKKPILIDFTAKWCPSCQELKNTTFKNEKVIQRLNDFEVARIDVTKNSKEDLEMLKEFDLYGPPALIFFKDGKELNDKKVIGFIEPEKLIEKISDI